MSLTVWLVVLIPLALFGWLIGQAMPSPRERQLARMRSHARSLELDVSVRALPDPDPDARARVDSSGRALDARLDVAGYGRAVRLPAGVERRHAPSWRLLNMRHHPDERFAEGLPPGWRLERSELPLTDAVLGRLSALLERAPAGTVSLESGPTGVTLYWRERGGDAEIETIASLLEAASALQTELAVAASSRESAAREGRSDDR